MENKNGYGPFSSKANLNPNHKHFVSIMMENWIQPENDFTPFQFSQRNVLPYRFGFLSEQDAKNYFGLIWEDLRIGGYTLNKYETSDFIISISKTQVMFIKP